MNISRLTAKRVRRGLMFSDTVLTADQLYDLVLMETGNKEKAGKAWKAQRHAELRAGVTPD